MSDERELLIRREIEIKSLGSPINESTKT